MINTTDIIIWIAFLISFYFLVFWLLVLFEEKPKRIEKTNKLKKYPSVSITVPAYNEEKNIASTLKSLINLNYPKEKLEIIVVNDGSKDKTKEVVEKLKKQHATYDIKLVNQKNRGKGSALNAGLKIAKGEFFVCLDADSVASKDILINLLPYFENNEVAVVLPLMKLRNVKTVLQKIQWCEYLINFFYKKLMAALDCVHVSPGPFSIYRKSVLLKVGGFDEHNMTEDLEITLRIQKYDYKIIQSFNAEVYTIAPSSFRAFYRQRNRWYKGSLINMLKYRFMFFNKKYEEFGMLQIPRVATAGILMLLLIFFTLYRFIKPLIEKLIALSFVNFDIWTFIKNLSFDIRILDIYYPNIFYGAIIFFIGLIVIYLAHRYTNETWTKQGKFTVPVYLILYSTLLSIVWIGIAIDLIRGKIQKW